MVKRGFKIDKVKSPPQGIINERKRPVRRIHGGYDMEVGWNKKLLVQLQCIGQPDGVVLVTFIRLDEGQQLPKNGGDVATINLVDYQDIMSIWITCGAFAKPEKNPVPQFKTTVGIGPEALNKILVAIGRVELYRLEVLTSLRSDEGPCETASNEGLARPRRAA